MFDILLLIARVFLVSFVLLFFFFAFVIWLREAARRNAKKHPRVARVVFYIPAIIFLVADVAFNILYGSIMFMEFVNKHGEGLTLTSRLKWHINIGLAAIRRGAPPARRFVLAAWLCRRFLQPVDPLHCGLPY